MGDWGIKPWETRHNIAETTVKNINIIVDEILFKDENQLHFKYISATY